MADVDRQIVEAIREYIVAKDKTKFLTSFDKEFGTGSGQTTSRLTKTGSEILSFFAKGQGPQFLSAWEKHIPSNILEKDRTCRRIESSCQIHFAVFHLRHGSSPQSSECRAAMEAFQHFLQNRGKQMGEFEEFAPIFALPYVPDASKHKPFEHIFTDGWVADLKTRLETFLKSALKSSREPLLVKLVKGMASDMSKGSTAELPAGRNEVEQMRVRLAECEERALLYIRKFNHSQNDYQMLLKVAADLVQTLQDSVGGKQISALEIQSLCSRLFGSSLEKSLDFSRPATGVDVLQSTLNDMSLQSSQAGSLLPSLDYDKIKNTMLRINAKPAALLLQALRLRLTQSLPGEQRECVVKAYIESDIFGCAAPGKYQDLMHKALKSSNPDLQESAARFLNALASLRAGRMYLSQHKKLIPNLLKVLEGCENESFAMRSLLAALQKLSLLRPQQTAMIKCGIIKWLLQVLGDTESQSPHTLHYASALLMNLCLRNAGKVYCTSHAPEVLKVLSELLEGDDLEARSYINGSLYSLLSVPQIREEAREMGLDVILTGLKAASPPNMASQLSYVLTQLNSESDDASGGEDTDDDGEDMDDEEVPEVLDDVDSGDMLKPEAGHVAGEDLLCKDFLAILSGRPKATRPKTGGRAPENFDFDRPLDRPVTPRHPHLLADRKGSATPPSSRPSSKAQTSARSGSATASGASQTKPASNQPKQQRSQPSTQAHQTQSTKPTSGDKPQSARPAQVKKTAPVANSRPATSAGSSISSGARASSRPTASQSSSTSPDSGVEARPVPSTAESTMVTGQRVQPASAAGSTGRGYGRGSAKTSQVPSETTRRPGTSPKLANKPVNPGGVNTNTLVLSYSSKSQESGSPVLSNASPAPSPQSPAGRKPPHGTTEVEQKPAAGAANKASSAPDDYRQAFDSRPRIARTPERMDAAPDSRIFKASPLGSHPQQSDSYSPISDQGMYEPAMASGRSVHGEELDFTSASAQSAGYADSGPSPYGEYDDDNEYLDGMSRLDEEYSEECPNIAVTVSGSGRKSILAPDNDFYTASPPTPREDHSAANQAQAEPAKPKSTSSTRSTSGSRPNHGGTSQAQSRSTVAAGSASSSTSATSQQGTDAPRRSTRHRAKPGQS